MFEVRTPIRVRYGETDVMGVVYHAEYLAYLHEARDEFIAAVYKPYPEIERETGVIFPIYSVDVRYLGSLRYGDQAFVVTTLQKMTSARVTYQHRIYREGDDPATASTLIEATTTTYVADRLTLKPTTLKKSVPELYERYRRLLDEASQGKAGRRD